MTGLESSSKAGSDKSKEYSIYANYSHYSSFEVFRLLKAYIFNVLFFTRECYTLYYQKQGNIDANASIN